MDVTLNPFTFTFSNVNLERRFALYQAEKHLCIEPFFVFLDVIFILGRQFTKLGPTGLAGFVASCAAVGIHYVHFMRARRDIMIQYLLFRRFAFRASFAVLFKCVLPCWVVPLDYEGFFSATALRCGMVTLIWHGIGLQTRFREFIFTQAIFTIIFAAAISHSVCLGLLERPVHEANILQLWKTVQDFSAGFDGNLNRLFFNKNANALDVCPTLISTAHAVFSFALPTFIVGTYEIQCRYRYLESNYCNGWMLGFRLSVIAKTIRCLYIGTLPNILLDSNVVFSGVFALALLYIAIQG